MQSDGLIYSGDLDFEVDMFGIVIEVCHLFSSLEKRPWRDEDGGYSLTLRLSDRPLAIVTARGYYYTKDNKSKLDEIYQRHKIHTDK